MNKQIDIASIIASRPGARRMEGVPNAWYWSHVGFHFVLAVTSNAQRAFQWTMRDFFDEGLARATLACALKHEREVLEAMPLVVLEGFSADNFKFNVVVGMPPVNGLEISNIAELQSLTYHVFPAHRYEFSGNETLKECVGKVDKLVDTVNPLRKPQPHVRLLYVNTSTKGKISGNKRILYYADTLLRELGKLDGVGSFVEFENYRGLVARAATDGGALKLTCGATTRVIDKEALVAWAEKFITTGEASECS